MVALAATRVLVARSKPDEAAAHLARSIATAESRGRLGVALELRILHSLVLVRQGRPRDAYAGLERALTLAEAEGYVRIFLDEGRPMQMLLAQWLAHSDGAAREYAALRAYVRRLLTWFDAEPDATAVPPGTSSDGLAEPGALRQPGAPPRTGALIEPLSERELEVLHLIALGSTNKEIAEQLFVAVGTVKAHTSSIYGKLDVANRTEAVARARQLGILS
jgi:LuxR family maltose regulon positive regulatory protein